MRAKNQGLGFGGSEKTEQQILMEMKAEGLMEDAQVKEEKMREPNWKKKEQEQGDVMEIEPVGKKKKERKPKKVYVSAEEFQKSQKVKKQIILDLTKEQPRVITDLAQQGLYSEVTGKAEPGIPAPELQHNIKFLVDTKEIELQNIDRRFRHEQSMKTKLKREEENLEKRVEQGAEQVKRLKTVIEIIGKCQEKIKMNDMDLETLAKVFDMFRNKYAREYEIFKLSALAYSMVFPLIKSKLETWNPLKEPSFVVDIISVWKRVLHKEEEGDQMDEEDQPIKDNLSEMFAKKKQSTHSLDIYDRMISEIVLPVIRRALINEWNPRDYASATRLVESLQPPLLTKEVYNNILLHIILPKIMKEVETWNPRQDTMPIHAWLHPWLPYLSKHMDALYPTIRHKLGVALQVTPKDYIVLNSLSLSFDSNPFPPRWQYARVLRNGIRLTHRRMRYSSRGSAYSMMPAWRPCSCGAFYPSWL